jgi:hypothetical protein
MNLVNFNSVQIAERSRVAPNKSGVSYLTNKILRLDIALGTPRMPANEGGIVVLCDAEIEAIREWIDDGAIVP